MDGEDGAGNIIEGGWREEESPSGLTPISHVGSNRLITCMMCIINFVIPDTQEQLPELEMVTNHTSIVTKEKFVGSTIMCDEQIHISYTTRIKNWKSKIGIWIIIISWCGIVHGWSREVTLGREFSIEFYVNQNLLDLQLCNGLLSSSEAMQCCCYLLPIVAFLIYLLFPSLLVFL